MSLTRSRSAVVTSRSSTICPSRSEVPTFADRYPHAGGPDHTVQYVVNAHGFEAEVVVEPDES